MKQFNLEAVEISLSTLWFNASLSTADIGKFGVRERGFKRIIEICETESAANDVIEAVNKNGHS